MSPLNEFLQGYTAGMAAGIWAQVSPTAIGFAFGVAVIVMTGLCALMGCLWLLWRGCCRLVTTVGTTISVLRAFGNDG